MVFINEISSCFRISSWPLLRPDLTSQSVTDSGWVFISGVCGLFPTSDRSSICREGGRGWGVEEKWYLELLPSILKFCSIYNLDISMFNRVMATLTISPGWSRCLAHRKHSTIVFNKWEHKWMALKTNKQWRWQHRFWVLITPTESEFQGWGTVICIYKYFMDKSYQVCEGYPARGQRFPNLTLLTFYFILEYSWLTVLWLTWFWVF